MQEPPSSALTAGYPIVGYGSTTEIEAGYWFADSPFDTIWDAYVGQYFFSFRYMPYVFISTYVVTTLTTWFTVWIMYEGYWCLFWDTQKGKGRRSACMKPVPDNLS